MHERLSTGEKQARTEEKSARGEKASACERGVALGGRTCGKWRSEPVLKFNNCRPIPNTVGAKYSRSYSTIPRVVASGQRWQNVAR